MKPYTTDVRKDVRFFLYDAGDRKGRPYNIVRENS